MRYRHRIATVLTWTSIACSILGPASQTTQATQATVPTGDQHLDYAFAEAHAQMPYRLYVPTRYDGSTPYPLVVVLHGSGSDENAPFAHSNLRQIAEERGYILVCPLGYNNFGGYGDIYPVVVTRGMRADAAHLRDLVRSGAHGYPPAMLAHEEPAAADDYAELPASFAIEPTAGVLSEKDVMNVLDLVRHQYRIDPSRIYLMGNSMGGVGTLYLGARYPEVWAALAPSGGPIAAWSYPYERLRNNHIALLLVHGQLDAHSNAAASQAIATAARAEGVDASVLVVKSGDHAKAWTEVLPETFDFFSQHVRH